MRIGLRDAFDQDVLTVRRWTDIEEDPRRAAMLRFAADGDVAEQPVDVRDLVETGNAVFAAAFLESFDAAQENCPAVRNADGDFPGG